MTTPTSRRQFIRRLGLLGGAGLLSPAVLAACSSGDNGAADGDGGGGGGGDGGGSSDGGSGGGGGSSNALRIDNWPLYIDEETVGLFREETGIDLRYSETINDNYVYFARIQSDLAAGRDTGSDIFAPTYWLAARLIELGFVRELPLDDIPNAANLIPSLREPLWDPTGAFSLPWQSGMTGIAYNRQAAGRDLTSMDDLFDPAFRGKIGMLTEMRDTIGLLMLLEGVDPSTANATTTESAFARLEAAKADGTIRGFTGNDYLDDLASGNFVACIGWSGDVLQQGDPNLQFVVPEEGGMQWSDTMLMPNGAVNVDNAAAWMNYVYDPVNAARITAYVGFNSPVEGVQEVLAAGSEEEQELAASPFLFPDEATQSRLHVFASLNEDDEEALDTRFSAIIGA